MSNCIYKTLVVISFSIAAHNAMAQSPTPVLLHKALPAVPCAAIGGLGTFSYHWGISDVLVEDGVPGLRKGKYYVLYRIDMIELDKSQRQYGGPWNLIYLPKLEPVCFPVASVSKETLDDIPQTVGNWADIIAKYRDELGWRKRQYNDLQFFSSFIPGVNAACSIDRCAAGEISCWRAALNTAQDGLIIVPLGAAGTAVSESAGFVRAALVLQGATSAAAGATDAIEAWAAMQDGTPWGGRAASAIVQFGIAGISIKSVRGAGTCRPCQEKVVTPKAKPNEVLCYHIVRGSPVEAEKKVAALLSNGFVENPPPGVCPDGIDFTVGEPFPGWPVGGKLGYPAVVCPLSVLQARGGVIRFEYITPPGTEMGTVPANYPVKCLRLPQGTEIPPELLAPLSAR